MNLETNEILVFGVIGLAIGYWIIYEIIKAASFGKKIHGESVKQTKLLEALARKAGVTDEEIKAM